MKSGTACLAILLLTFAAQQASALDWASELFSERSHEFGTVARAAKTEFAFEFTNNTGREIHISSARTSCGCTTAIIPERTIAPGENGSIVARFNTSSFLGQRGATITVVFDRPNYREVQLRVDGYVRRDIVCNPGSIEFGQVTRGQSVSREIDIQYAGRNGWQIESIGCEIAGMECELIETRRGSGRVGYKLMTEWTAADPGYLQQTVTLRTNDRNRPQIPLLVSGRCVAALQTSPESIFWGDLRTGATASKRVVIRANEPFKINSIDSDDPRLTFNYSEDEKPIHIVEVTLAAGEESGDFQTEFVIGTSAGNDESATIQISGNVGESQE